MRKNENLQKLTSDSSTLRMIEYLPEYYAGINKDVLKDKSLLIVFDQDKNLIGFEGDQEQGKTSNLNCLSALLGAEEVKDAINEDAGTKRASLTIQVAGITYKVRITKTDFSLTKIEEQEGGKPITSTVQEPKSVLRRLIGPVGQDPMFLKSKDGKSQVEWIRTMYQLSADQKQLEDNINKEIQSSYDERTDFNRELKRASSLLKDSKYYSWDAKNKIFLKTEEHNQAQEKFVKDDTLRDEEIRQKVEATNRKVDKYNQDKARLNNLNDEKLRANSEIEDVKKQIEELNLRLKSLSEESFGRDKLIIEAEQAVAGNSTAESEYKAAIDEMGAQGNYKLEKKEYTDAQELFTLYSNLADKSLNATLKLDELYNTRKQLIALITPPIEGLEVCIPKRVDLKFEEDTYRLNNPDASNVDVETHLNSLKSETREGIFYNKRSVSQMSESQLFRLWILLCKELQIKVAFIENITNLGTGAVEAINEFAAAGGVVFFSAMQRGKTELKVSFYRNL